MRALLVTLVRAILWSVPDCRGRICQSEQTDDRLLFTAVCLCCIPYTKEYRIIVEYLKAQDT